MSNMDLIKLIIVADVITSRICRAVIRQHQRSVVNNACVWYFIIDWNLIVCHFC